MSLVMVTHTHTIAVDSLKGLMPHLIFALFLSFCIFYASNTKRMIELFSTLYSMCMCVLDVCICIRALRSQSSTL